MSLEEDREHEDDHAEQPVQERVAEHQEADALAADGDVLRFEVIDDLREVAVELVVLVRVDANLLEALGETAEHLQHFGFARVQRREPAIQRRPPDPEADEREERGGRDHDERHRRQRGDIEQAEHEQKHALRRADEQRHVLRKVVDLLRERGVDLAAPQALQRPQFGAPDLVRHAQPQVGQACLQQAVGFQQRRDW